MSWRDLPYRCRAVSAGRGVGLLLVLASVLGIVGAGWGQTALQAPPRSTLARPLRPALPHPTLDRIRAADAVVCGVVKEEEDYSRSEDHGNRAAFDIDLCTAVAVAVLGPGAHLVVKSFPDEPFALRALRSGEVDLVGTAGLTAANMATDVAFSAPVLMDGQGMLLLRSGAVRTPAEMAGKRICFLTGSAAEDGLHSYAAAQGVSFVWYPFSEAGEMEAAFFTGNCDAITSDMTQLANIRAIDPRRAAEFAILPEVMRQDPLAMATWAGDPSLAAVVYWTAELLLGAERLGVSRAALPAGRTSERPEIRQLLGQRYGVGAALGLRPQWGAEVIGAVGNYGEIFDRDLGAQSPLRLQRGDNRLTGATGALYPVPVRDR